MAKPQRFKNLAKTTLASGIASTGDPVTISVASASGFPTDGNFTVLIGSELFLVTAVSGTNLTASRAQEGTSMAAHSTSDNVTLVVTGANIITTMQDAFYQDALANKFSGEQDGRLQFNTDSHKLLRDDGSNYIPYGKLERWYEPSNTGFSWVNQGSCSLDTSQYGLYLNRTDNNSQTPAIRTKSAPSAPYKLDVRFEINHHWKQAMSVFVGFRESSSGKLHSYIISTPSTFNNYGRPRFASAKHTNATTFSADYAAYTLGCQIPKWVRLEDDNTNRKIWVSMDGIQYELLHSIGRTDFLTANELFFGLEKDTSDTTNKVGFRILSWRAY